MNSQGIDGESDDRLAEIEKGYTANRIQISWDDLTWLIEEVKRQRAKMAEMRKLIRRIGE